MTAATHPVTLFTGQWADLPLEEVARLAADWGYDGLEIACSGEHLDVWRAAEDDAYLRGRLEILDKHGLKAWAISNHLKGQAVCDDPIDFRHQAIVGSRVWGDGEAEGVRQRAAEELKLTAKVARKMGIDTVVGFTGSSIWQYVAMFPPVPASAIDAGYEDFAGRWNPILDVFDAEGVRFAHEVHPGEIAYDYHTSLRALQAIGRREAFGFNWDPSHMMWQHIDPAHIPSTAAGPEAVTSPHTPPPHTGSRLTQESPRDDHTFRIHAGRPHARAAGAARHRRIGSEDAYAARTRPHARAGPRRHRAGPGAWSDLPPPRVRCGFPFGGGRRRVRRHALRSAQLGR
jgi:sugar phosphate isomerase/epimerase